MARNKPQKPLTDNPPSAEEETTDDDHEPTVSTANSDDVEEDDEEEIDTSDSDAEDDDEDEQPQPTPPPSAAKKPSTTSTAASATNKRPHPAHSNDASDDELQQKFKSPSSKSRSKATVAGLAAEKRPSEAEPKPSLKKAKKEKSVSGPTSPPPYPSSSTQEEGSKKVLFQRIFSEDDEMVILKGMIEYRDKKGFDPMNEIDDFYGFIKKSLHVDVNKGQLADKLRRLKKKFQNAKKKKLTNPRDIQAFELSRNIWDGFVGDANNNVVAAAEDDKVSNGDGVKAVENHTNANNVGAKLKVRVSKSKSGGGVVEEQKNNKVDEESEKIVVKEKDVEYEVGEAMAWEKLRKKGLKLMGEKDRAEIEEMWEMVAIKQAEATMLRAEAEQEEIQKILDAVRSSKN